MTIILVAEGYFRDLEVKSTRKIVFQSYFCQITFHRQTVYEKVFLKSSFIWMHITRSTTYHLSPWPPHWIYNMDNHGVCDRKCRPSRLYLLHFFADISHFNDQQNITEYLVNITGGHAPGHHDLHIIFFKMATCFGSSFKLDIYLKYHRDFLYISVRKVQ